MALGGGVGSRWLGAGTAVILGLTSGLWYGLPLSRLARTDSQKASFPVVTQAAGPSSNAAGVGWFTAVRSQAVWAAATGYVRSVYVQDGDFVRAGQLLIKLYAVNYPHSKQLAPAFIIAPTTGIITDLSASPGLLLRPTTQVALLQVVDWMRIDFVLPATQADADSGTLVQVVVAELNNRQFPGYLQTIRPPATPDQLWMASVIVANHSRPYLRPGMQGQILWPSSCP